jgi:cytochrome P450
MVMQSFRFKDGLLLPAGTQLSFPTYQYSQDGDIHADPAVFDPMRHLRKRLEIDLTKYHFASTADSLVWGSGPHACPGRFLAQDALKLIFIYMLTHYELKWPEEGKRRPDSDAPSYLSITPDVTIPVLFKEVAV